MSREFAGTLRERILIERPVEARTSIGVQRFGWERVGTCLASIVPEAAAGSLAEAMALSAMSRFVVTIRARDGIMVGQRVVWGTRSLMVRQLTGDPRAADRIVMRCEEARS